MLTKKNLFPFSLSRDFNLMFQTSVGAMADGVSVAYLRPETAQVSYRRQKLFEYVQKKGQLYIIV